jgi:hypothetical protein
LRVKDLLDVHAILERVPLSRETFWRTVAEEFASACRARQVDCVGWQTFQAIEMDARGLYERDPLLRQLADFDAVWRSTEAIVRWIERTGALQEPTA